jgi:hypothetical protein
VDVAADRRFIIVVICSETGGEFGQMKGADVHSILCLFETYSYNARAAR